MIEEKKHFILEKVAPKSKFKKKKKSLFKSKKTPKKKTKKKKPKKTKPDISEQND